MLFIHHQISHMFFSLNCYFMARSLRGIKLSRFRGRDLKSAKLKCRQKYFFRATAKLKCRKIWGVWTPALSRYNPNCALKFLNQFRKNAFKNQFKKRKIQLKRCTNRILLKFFNTILRSILKRGSHQ